MMKLERDRSPIVPECVSVEEAAIIAGVGRTTAYELIRQGKFPHKRIGGRIVVPLKPLRAWLNTTDNNLYTIDN